MRRIPIWLFLLALLAGLIFLIERGPGRSTSDVVVQFLGMTNDPDLGPSGIFSITNMIKDRITFYDSWITIKTPQSGRAILSEAHWKFSPFTNVHGLADHSHWILILENGSTLKGGVVVVVAAPSSKSAWQVNFTGRKPWPNWLEGLDRSIGGFLGRHVGRPGFSVASPEMKE